MTREGRRGTLPALEEAPVKLRSAALLALLTAILFTAPSALAAPEGWHKSLEDGQKAARGSGKPILVVTAWREGV